MLVTDVNKIVSSILKQQTDEIKKLPYTQALEWSDLLRLIDKGARPAQPGLLEVVYTV